MSPCPKGLQPNLCQLGPLGSTSNPSNSLTSYTLGSSAMHVGCLEQGHVHVVLPEIAALARPRLAPRYLSFPGMPQGSSRAAVHAWCCLEMSRAPRLSSTALPGSTRGGQRSSDVGKGPGFLHSPASGQMWLELLGMERHCIRVQLPREAPVATSRSGHGPPALAWEARAVSTCRDFFLRAVALWKPNTREVEAGACCRALRPGGLSPRGCLT